MQTDNLSEIYYNKGITDYEEGEYHLSIENFKKAVELNESVFDYHYNLGLAYIKTEEYDLAIESFNKGIELNSKDSDIYQNLGIAFFNKGEFNKAVKAYKQAVMINSADPENFANAGAAYFSLEKYKEAIFYFKQAVKLEPRNSTYNYNLAYTYYITEKYDIAEDYLINSINYNKQDYDAYFLLGNVYLKQNNSLLAKNNFEKVLKLNPDHEEAQTALEEINSNKNPKPEVLNKDEAKPLIKEKPLEIKEPEILTKSKIEIEAENYFNSAVDLLVNKEYEAAIIEFKNTLTLIEDHSQAIKNINLASKRLAEAQELFNKGLMYFSQNEFSKAINYLEKAIYIYPHDKKFKDLLNQAISKNKEMGQSYLKSGQYDLAIESLKTALKEDPKDPETHFTLGNAYIEQEEYDLALDTLRDTLSLDPNHKEAQEAVYNVIKELNTHNYKVDDYFKLSLTYISRQEYSKALKSLKKILQLDPDNSATKTLILKVTELINKSKSIQ